MAAGPGKARTKELLQPTFVGRLLDWFLSEEVRKLPPSLRRRSRFAVGSSLALFVLVDLLAPLMYQAEGLSPAVLVVLTAGPLCILNALCYRWIKSHTLPGTLFSFMLVGLLVVAASGAGPVSACARQWHIASPLLACFLAGFVPAVICGAVSLAHLSFLIAQAMTMPGPLATNGEFWSRMATLFVTFFVGGLALIYERTRQRAEEEEERRHLEEHERLTEELEIAARIQTSILPAELKVPGLEISTRMLPTTEVGGDYYDVLPVEGGCWMGIGDVSGHGLNAGLIMMMLQSIIATLSHQSPDATPRELMNLCNRVLFTNIRGRLKKDDYITLTLLRYFEDGRLVAAGAHEDMLIWRAREKRCEVVTSRGAWVGAMRSIERFTKDTERKLEEGDVVLLYTDGLPEAMNAQGELFGVERLEQEFRRLGDKSVQEIRDGLLEAVRRWTATPQDDMTVMVIRHVGTASQVAAA